MAIVVSFMNQKLSYQGNIWSREMKYSSSQWGIWVSWVKVTEKTVELNPMEMGLSSS